MPTLLKLHYNAPAAAVDPSNTSTSGHFNGHVAPVAEATGIREILMAAMYPVVSGLGFDLNVSQN